MSYLNVTNNATSTLASGISDVDTSLDVQTGEGSKYPSSNFHITIEDEILLCSLRTNDTLTVERAKEGTSASSHEAGKVVQLRLTAEIITELQDDKEDVSNKKTDLTDNSDTYYPSQKAVKTAIDGLSLQDISDITSNEETQLSNINSVTITNAQWGYLGGLDQSLATDDDPTFGALTVTSIGGITEANLLDKSASETITGTWTFNKKLSEPNLINPSNCFRVYGWLFKHRS